MSLKPIACVQASWHTDITEHCKAAFMAEWPRTATAPTTSSSSRRPAAWRSH